MQYAHHLCRVFRLALVTAGLAAPASGADVRLARIFSDHMVLQRDQPVTVWGWAKPDGKITVAFGGQSVSGVADKRGEWSVRLQPLKASASPRDLTVNADATVKLSDVLVGDVWMVSGQSNAAFGLGGCKAPEDVSSANFPLIRFSGYWEHFANAPQRDGGAPWNVMSPGTAGGCSGIGFYFARKVQPEAGVPIGILTCAVGGTDIENWMSPEAINNYPENASVAKDYREAITRWESELPASKATPGQRPAYLPVDEPIGLDLTTKWLAKVSASLQAANTPLDPTFIEFETWVGAAQAALKEHRSVPVQPELEPVGKWLLTTPLPAELKRIPILPHPTDRNGVGGHGWFRTQSLYNGMIHPFIPFAIKGMLWYQGEGANGVPYYHRMRSMVETMRKEKGRNFPVYIVQLPNYDKPTDNPAGDGPNKWPGTREQMLKCLQIPNTGLAVTIDVGDAADLHPSNKKDVGERLALWALAKDYGRKVVFSGPLYKGIRIGNGKITVDFDSVGGGLMVGRKDGVKPVVEDKGAKLKRFAIAGEDRKWVWADAVIEGATVVVSSPEVPKPVAVRYAYAMNPEGCNLFNKEGLPASPFRSDDWMN